jgi:hypothetical protein
MNFVTLRQQCALLNAEPLRSGEKLIARPNNAKLTRNNQWTT